MFGEIKVKYIKTQISEEMDEKYEEEVNAIMQQIEKIRLVYIYIYIYIYIYNETE